MILAFVFERERDARAEIEHLAVVVDREIHLGDFGNAQVAQRFGRGLDRPLGGILPGFVTDADAVDDPVNAALAAFRHGDLPSLLLTGGSLTRRGHCETVLMTLTPPRHAPRR